MSRTTFGTEKRDSPILSATRTEYEAELEDCPETGQESACERGEQRMAGRGEEDRDRSERFAAFVAGLERLSAEHGVVLQVTGGVCIQDGPVASVEYDRDCASGDLRPISVDGKAWS